MTREPFYLNNVLIGHFVNHFIFITSRDKGKHLMIKFNGYGVSLDVLQRLERLGIKYIIFRIKGDIDYRFSLKQYLDSNLVHVFNNSDIQKFVDIKEALN